MIIRAQEVDVNPRGVIESEFSEIGANQMGKVLI
jgi:hypothetical protein